MSEGTTAGPRPAEPTAATEDATIRPFRVGVPDEGLADLRRRIAATRWPSRELVADRSQGVQLATSRSSPATGPMTTTCGGSRPGGAGARAGRRRGQPGPNPPPRCRLTAGTPP